MLKAYGLEFPDGTTQATIELYCFRQDHQPEHGGLGRYQHYRNAVNLRWNEPRHRAHLERKIPYDPDRQDAYIWNDWSELMSEAFCENPWTTVTGPGASWKTTSAALYGLNFWQCSPHNTVVILTSTTLDGLRRRIWKEVTKYYRMDTGGIGNLVQSRNCVQYIKGSDDAGIFGVAVDKGEVDKAVQKIIGFHAENVLVIVDEMQTVNEAIVKACVNLQSGAARFQFIGLGNATSELDPHGQMSEPLEGWDSITPESVKWQTKRGICIHLDGLDSPNIRAGEDKFPGLLRKRDIEETIRDYGEDSPEFWQQRRGFWAPQGVTRTVLSTTMITKFRAREKAIWSSGFKMGAGLDPAFEGVDRCILRFGKCGEFSGTAPIEEPGTFRPIKEKKGTVGIELGDIVQVKLSATGDEPTDYQIVRICKDECEKRGIGPEMFALDATGQGGSLASIFEREWSPLINKIEFGGRASDLPVSEFNKKPSRDEYLNRVTELWYTFRTMVQNGQIRGLDNDTAIEFCSRLYNMRGNLKQVETKKEMKMRTKRSPDLADATVVLCEMFRNKLHLSIGGNHPHSIDTSWADFLKKNDTADENAYLIEA